jgi:putative transcriptional regulator
MINFTGKLLIAPPKMKTGFWYKSVIFITEDHINGSMGIILNKRSSITISDFTDQIGERLNIPGHLYIGGPVNIKALTMLHSSEWAGSNTMRIDDKFSLSSSDDLLPRLADGDAPRYFRLFLGLCGWAPTQLQEEYDGAPPRDRNASWLIANATQDLVFHHDLKDQWIQALEKSSNDFVQSIFA